MTCRAGPSQGEACWCVHAYARPAAILDGLFGYRRPRNYIGKWIKLHLDRPRSANPHPRMALVQHNCNWIKGGCGTAGPVLFVQHRFAFCCGYDLKDWNGFLGLFRGLRDAAGVDDGLDWDEWKSRALDRYNRHCGLRTLLSRETNASDVQ